MMNPIKEVREQNKLTMKAFASLAGIGEQNVVKAEAGMGASLPPSIVEVICRLTGETPTQVMDNYEAWIQQELSEVKLPPASSDFMVANREQFTEWKNTVCYLNQVPNTTVGFCKIFKLHPYVIDKWESGKLKSAPLQLVQRLARMRGIL